MAAGPRAEVAANRTISCLDRVLSPDKLVRFCSLIQGSWIVLLRISKGAAKLVESGPQKSLAISLGIGVYLRAQNYA